MAKRKKVIPKHKPIDPIRAALEVVEAAIGEPLTTKRKPAKKRTASRK